MSRPRKCRRVCCMPGSRNFGPLGDEREERKGIVMTIDEFEAIRLIDLERLSQEECAERMNVARTTAQAIYNSARIKLAEFIVNSMDLSINGGDYVLCDGVTSNCGCHHCHKRIYHSGENEK